MDLTTRFFLLWTFVLIGRPQDTFQALQATRPALVLSIITLTLVLMNSERFELPRVLRILEAKKYLLFYLIMILGIPFAYHKRVAFEYAFVTYAGNIMYFLACIAIVNTVDKLKSFLFVMAMAACWYGVIGLSEGTVIQGRLFMRGSASDPNDLAYVLISLFPASAYFIVCPPGALKRLFAVTSLIASLGVILLSGSRGGLLGLATVILAFIVTERDRIRWRYKVGLLLVITGVVLVYSDSLNMERYLSLGNIDDDYNATAEGGRMDIWGKGLYLISEYPLTGVGVQCFPMALGYLRSELDLLPKWQVMHNSYLEVAAETGLIGFWVFLGLTRACYQNFTLLASLGANQNTSPEINELKALGSLLRIGLLGSLVAAFFLSQGYSPVFTSYFALSAVLRRVSSQDVTFPRLLHQSQGS